MASYFRSIKKYFQIFIAFNLVFSLSACGVILTNLKMAAERPLDDKSILSPRLAAKGYRRIMIVPPSGTARGQLDNEMAFLEKEFIKGGLTVISIGITGRIVVVGQITKEGKKDENAAELSDVERALIMAEKTGAEAILQIATFSWTTDSPATRYFVREEGSSSYREVSKPEYLRFEGKTYTYNSNILTFIARLIDVQSGEVMASFNIRCAGNWNLPRDYSATIQEGNGSQYIVKENYPYSPGYFWEESTKKTLDRVLKVVIKRIMGLVPTKVEKPPSP